MKRKSIARLIAVLLLGYGFAFLVADTDRANMAHYRTLGKTELLAELEKKSDDSFDDAFFMSLLVIGLITAGVEGLAALIALWMDRISPVPPPEPAHEDTSAGPTLHFH